MTASLSSPFTTICMHACMHVLMWIPIPNISPQPPYLLMLHYKFTPFPHHFSFNLTIQPHYQVLSLSAPTTTTTTLSKYQNTKMVSNTIQLSFFLLFLFFSGVYTATFTLKNECTYTVWPGILSNAGTDPLSTTGFSLQPGESNAISVPASWSGRLWGRTLCSQDDSTGKFTCITGDCGSSTVECSGSGAVPPATLAEFTLNGAGGLDFYDVSLVDGYNLPMTVVAEGGSGGNCTSTGCVVDLNAACPSELKVMNSDEGVACKSACEAFRDPQYCCNGAYGTPDTCKPSSYSQFFKSACPRAYSYAYDDGTSTFTCASANYVITFCDSLPTSLKSSNGQHPVAVHVSAGTRDTTPSFLGFGIIALLAVVWWLRELF